MESRRRIWPDRCDSGKLHSAQIEKQSRRTQHKRWELHEQRRAQYLSGSTTPTPLATPTISPLCLHPIAQFNNELDIKALSLNDESKAPAAALRNNFSPTRRMSKKLLDINHQIKHATMESPTCFPASMKLPVAEAPSSVASVGSRAEGGSAACAAAAPASSPTASEAHNYSSSYFAQTVHTHRRKSRMSPLSLEGIVLAAKKEQ
jgi:hypothetical protein